MNNSDRPAMPNELHKNKAMNGLTKREYVKAHAPAMPDSFLDAWQQQLTVEEVELYSCENWNELNMDGFKEAHQAWLNHHADAVLGEDNE